MNVNDWFEVPQYEDIKMFSANGVPYPLDEYLSLCGDTTACQAVEIFKRLGSRK